MKRIIDLTNGKNCRDIGGYKTSDGNSVKWNKLIRSGELTQLDEMDVSLLSNRGVAHIIDIRNLHEQENKPDIIPAGAKHHAIPVFHSDAHQNIPQGQFISMYDDLIFDPHAQKAYLNIFKFLLANETADEAILYHCLGGKDRTGLVTILILYVLGVPKETILDDYLLTNDVTKRSNDEFMSRIYKTAESPAEILHWQDTITVKKEYFDRAIKNMTQESGSIENYIREKVGLSEAEEVLFRNKYLE